MDEAQREELLARINSQGATIGAQIPDTITLAGDELHLSEFLIETRKVDRIPPEAEEKLTEAKRALREARARRVERLETESLALDTAEAIADEVVGIDRALNALENIRHPDFGDHAHSAKIADHKKWLGFLDTVRR
ncbi:MULTISPECIES: DUF5788 family protein [Salinibaculum]|uniref:DUF5788 family protein n=1 Tax=Salinibaculum TaxID=2732368 RepID=UPI0030CD887E